MTPEQHRQRTDEQLRELWRQWRQQEFQGGQVREQITALAAHGIAMQKIVDAVAESPIKADLAAFLFALAVQLDADSANTRVTICQE